MISGLLSLRMSVVQSRIVSVWGKWELRSENGVCEGRGSCCRVSVCLVMSAESLEPIGGGDDDSIRRKGERGRTGASEMRLLLAFEAGERAGVVKDFYVTVVMNERTSILLRFDFISEVKGIDSRHAHYATASDIHAIKLGFVFTKPHCNSHQQQSWLYL